MLDTDQLRKIASLDSKYQQLIMAVNNRDSLPPPESGINHKTAELSTVDGLISVVTKSYHLMYPNMLEASMFVPKCWTFHMKVILVEMQ